MGDWVGHPPREIEHKVEHTASTAAKGLTENPNFSLSNISDQDINNAGKNLTLMFATEGLATEAEAGSLGLKGGEAAAGSEAVAPLSKTGLATETVEVGGASGAIKEGIYEAPDATAPGLTRVGQSGNMPRRLPEQEAAGRFPEGTQVRVTEVPGGKTAREIAEHNRIQELGGVRSVPGSQTSNIRNPIGKARQDLLKP